jgi:hypothetical protein
MSTAISAAAITRYPFWSDLGIRTKDILEDPPLPLHILPCMGQVDATCGTVDAASSHELSIVLVQHRLGQTKKNPEPFKHSVLFI